MLFEEVIRMWLNEKKVFIKESTYAYYYFEVENYIIPMLGNVNLDNLSEKVIQETVLVWQSRGAFNQPLKKSTVQNIVMLIKQTLKFAQKGGFIDEYKLNIRFAPIVSPVLYNKNKKVFSCKEQANIIQAVFTEPSYRSFGILLCLNSGLRIGEICALRWEDFDFANGIIHITKTLQRIYDPQRTPRTQIIISTPKTATSIREIPLSSKMMQVIQQLKERKTLGYVLTNEDFFLEPRTFRKFYTKFLLKHDIEPLNFHCLRHTFATRCIENGGDYKSVSEILGHTTINTTLNMYVHPQVEEKRKCVDLINWEVV